MFGKHVVSLLYDKLCFYLFNLKKEKEREKQSLEGGRMFTACQQEKFVLRMFHKSRRVLGKISQNLARLSLWQ